MKLLVSVVNLEEAEDALEGGCDIIDVKNPYEGSLGANHPSIIKSILDHVGNRVEVSATIGDLPNLPGTASLAGLGAASLEINYVKAGLYGVQKIDSSIKMAKWIVTAVKGFHPHVKVILCGYGDYKYIGSLNPKLLPKVAYKSESDGILLDLKTKNRKTIFYYLSSEEIRNIVLESHDYGLTFALAGGLNSRHVALLKRLDVDIMGVRRGVSYVKNWVNSVISKDKVRKLFLRVHEEESVNISV